jgi:hypothetical protein
MTVSTWLKDLDRRLAAAQHAAVERRGYDVPPHATKGEASHVLDRPTPRQRAALERHGRWDEDMTFNAAGEALDKLVREQGWKAGPPANWSRLTSPASRPRLAQL